MKTQEHIQTDNLLTEMFYPDYAMPAISAVPQALFVNGENMRDKLAKLESALLASGENIAPTLPLKHYFSRGVYARELSIPKGAIITGKIHKFSQINFVLKGDLTVLVEDGARRVKAGEVIVSPAGTKRAVFAHEDSVWVTVSGSNETDLERLENELIAKDWEEYDVFAAKTIGDE